MLGRKTLTADATLAGPTDFDTTQLALGQLELGFTVEEDEMLVDLEARLTYSNSVREATDFTFYVDGVASPDLPVEGLVRHTAAVIADENTVYVKATLRLAKGYHTAEARTSAPSGAVTIEGASMLCEVTARRNSHIGTLGHGVDAKAQLVQ